MLVSRRREFSHREAGAERRPATDVATDSGNEEVRASAVADQPDSVYGNPLGLLKVPTKAKPKKSTSVPGQALGYYQQETKMTQLLAEADEGSRVSLEVLDDVAVEGKDGSVSMVQTKSALTANPVSDRAISLWKTLANWAEDLSTQTDFSQLLLVLSVSNPRDGDFVAAFHGASSVAAARTEIQRAKVFFAAELASPDSTEKNLTFHLKRFFAATPTIQAEVIRCFRLETSPSSPHADLPKSFKFIPQPQLEDVVRHALGWVKQQAELLMEAALQAILSRDEFHQEMIAYIRKHRERAILRSVAPAEVPKDKEAELFPEIFVRQLEIVGAEFNVRLQAVSDYFRATHDRTHWGESGEIHPSSIEEFDNKLHRSWTNLRQSCELQNRSLAEEDRGLVLFSQCSQHEARLEDQEVPNHSCPFLHHLANEQKVGWHPRYAAVLKLKIVEAPL